MQNHSLFSFPELHRELRPDLLECASCRWLWPGLSFPSEEMKKIYFEPDSLPMKERQAEQCLRDMRFQEKEVLAGVPVQSLIEESNSAAVKKSIEISEIKKFAEHGAPIDPKLEENAHANLLGQKLLLWAWLSEEHILELRALEKSCNTGTSTLLSGVWDDGESEENTPFSGISFPLTSQKTDDADLFPAWKVVLRHCIHFYPKNAVFMLPERLYDEFMDLLDFQLASESDEVGEYLQKCFPSSKFIIAHTNLSQLCKSPRECDNRDLCFCLRERS